MAGTYVLSGIGSDFTRQHNFLILEPNEKDEAALLSLDTYHSIPNITKGKNNKSSILVTMEFLGKY